MSEPMALIADRYRLQHVVGSGGMGVVWQAWDERLERPVALKQLHRQSGTSTAEAELANKRAMREARLTARLSHPHAVPVFDVVEQEGQLWLIMQFIPSLTLAAVLEEGGPLQPDEAAQVGAEVASALAAAHAVGIVHRDVKPRNILIAEDGAALISDFGIAHALGDATLTTRGMIHGTPAYLAPEVARGGEANFASDVFSLGATLYSAVEGSPPFGTDENSMALLHRVASGKFPPPRRTGVMTPVILKCSPLIRKPVHPCGQSPTAWRGWQRAVVRARVARHSLRLRRPRRLPAMQSMWPCRQNQPLTPSGPRFDAVVSAQQPGSALRPNRRADAAWRRPWP